METSGRGRRPRQVVGEPLERERRPGSGTVQGKASVDLSTAPRGAEVALGRRGSLTWNLRSRWAMSTVHTLLVALRACRAGRSTAAAPRPFRAIKAQARPQSLHRRRGRRIRRRECGGTKGGMKRNGGEWVTAAGGGWFQGGIEEEDDRPGRMVSRRVRKRGERPRGKGRVYVRWNRLVHPAYTAIPGARAARRLQERQLADDSPHNGAPGSRNSGDAACEPRAPVELLLYVWDVLR